MNPLRTLLILVPFFFVCYQANAQEEPSKTEPAKTEKQESKSGSDSNGKGDKSKEVPQEVKDTKQSESSQKEPGQEKPEPKESASKDKPTDASKDKSESGKDPKQETPEKNRSDTKKDKPNSEPDKIVNPPEAAPTKKAEPSKPTKKLLPKLGSSNNQMLPGQPWRIHDANRPRPKAIAPGLTNDAPPADAVVLFDGTTLSEWCHHGTEDEQFEPMWKVENGYVEIVPNTGSLYTIDSFGSCQLHIEWQIPEGVQGSSQNRGNSGVKLMERYELQILDSFKSKTYADGQAGSIYGQYPPLVNAVRPQGEWQTFDAFFEAPVYENDKLIKQPVVTLMHNGIFVHHHRELNGPTGAMPDRKSIVQPAAPILLQDHGSPIRFKNIWIRPF